MRDSNSIGDGMALFRHQQSPPLDLKAVEVLRCERTGHLVGTDTMPLGVMCPCISCRRYFALVPALLALLRETRAALEAHSCSYAHGDGACGVCAVLAKATEGQP